MLQTFKNAWRTKDIRSKLIFTAIILLIYRIGTVIPVPFVDAHGFAGSFSGTILDQMNILSGGSLEAATLFALGVQPYINASIIIQLLAVAFPKLGELSKDEQGKKVMSFITRIVTVGLALVTAIGYYFLLKNNGMLSAAATKPGVSQWLCAAVIVVCYCAGASLIMWLGERINEKGIGNGISMILFANIIAVLPSTMYALLEYLVIPSFSTLNDLVWLRATAAIVMALFIIAITIAMTVFIIWVTGSERRIPVQYAKKVVGRKMYGGQFSNLPIKLNMTGVMPVIFASSIVSLVPTILQLCGVQAGTKNFWEKLANFLSPNGWFYPVTLFLLIIGFAYFYTQITFNPIEVANNLKKQGGAIPGIRQGRPTSDYIRKVLNKITFVGALFLGIIAILPILAAPHVLTPLIDTILNLSATSASSGSEYASFVASKFTFGGTSLLIVVGVVLETFRELEAQLTMRNYKGFLN
jgi:preprotein translocase subunit SecY